MLASKKKKINDELKEIPTRISEVSNMLPKLPQEVNFTCLHNQKITTESTLKLLEDEYQQIMKNIEQDKFFVYETINEKQKLLLELRNKKSEIELQQKSKEQTKIAALSLIEAKKTDIERNNKAIKDFEDLIETLKEKRDRLREEYLQVDARVFETNENDTCCKACGQLLPENLKGLKIKDLRNKFDLAKTSDLNEVAQKGKQNNEQIDLFKKSIENHNERNKTLLDEIAKLENSISNVSMSTYEESNKLSTEIDTLSNEISGLKSQVESINYDDCVKEHRGKIEALKVEIEEINKTLALKEVYENSQKRIEELDLLEKHLSSVFVQLEKQIFGVEAFIKTRVDLLEGKLNSMFEGVKFKLFEEQINGGLQETFQTLINGVPYNDANGAAKINSGIEIINKLCRHYEFTAPIWIDNAESVVNLEKADSQVIKLVVSEGDKVLRVESDSN
jgi:DNA repair exonuclease SbcCD ATPase subunit